MRCYWARWVCVLLMLGLAAGVVQRSDAAAWVWCQYPYAYSIEDAAWCYVAPPEPAVYDFSARQWGGAPDGWIWLQWPYGYSVTLGAWVYTSAEGVWVYSYRTHAWTWVGPPVLNVAGTWTHPSFPGPRLVLSQTGSAVSGSYYPSAGGSPTASIAGTLTDDHIVLTLTFAEGVWQRWEGTVDGNLISGTMTSYTGETHSFAIERP